MAKLNSDNKDVIGNDMMKWYIDMLEKFPRGFTLFASPFHPTLQANHPEMVKTILKRGGKRHRSSLQSINIIPSSIFLGPVDKLGNND